MIPSPLISRLRLMRPNTEDEPQDRRKEKRDDSRDEADAKSIVAILDDNPLGARGNGHRLEGVVGTEDRGRPSINHRAPGAIETLRDDEERVGLGRDLEIEAVGGNAR